MSLTMNLCVLIPAKDEEAVIATTLKAYNLALQGTCDYQIVVVNDHSKDNTLEVLEELKTNMPNLSFIDNKGSKGVGGRGGASHRDRLEDHSCSWKSEGFTDDIYFTTSVLFKWLCPHHVLEHDAKS